MFISSIILTTRSKTIVETGVWKGKTTKFILELLYLNNIDSKIYGFDFTNLIEDLFNSDSFFRKIFHFRKYYAHKYFTLASVWGTIIKNTI